MAFSRRFTRIPALLRRGGRSPVVSGGGGGGGVAPTITVAPVLTWTVAHGSSPTIAEGTYTGDAGTWTYDLVRDGVDELTGVSKATVEAYVADRATDLGPDWKITATITNGSGSDSADSNVVTWDRSSLPLSGRHAGEGLTLADSGTTVDSWASSFGSISSTTSAATASERPAYSATGGAGGRPIIDFDGSSDCLRGPVTRGANWSNIESGFVGRIDAYAGTSGRWLMYDAALVRETGVAGAGTGRVQWGGIASFTGPTAGTLVHFSFDGATSATLTARIAGASIGTNTASATPLTDGSAFALGATAFAASEADIAAQADYVGAQLTSNQRLDLRALLTYLTGVSS